MLRIFFCKQIEEAVEAASGPNCTCTYYICSMSSELITGHTLARLRSQLNQSPSGWHVVCQRMWAIIRCNFISAWRAASNKSTRGASLCVRWKSVAPLLMQKSIRKSGGGGGNPLNCAPQRQPPTRLKTRRFGRSLLPKSTWLHFKALYLHRFPPPTAAKNSALRQRNAYCFLQNFRNR